MPGVEGMGAWGRGEGERSSEGVAEGIVIWRYGGGVVWCVRWGIEVFVLKKEELKLGVVVMVCLRGCDALVFGEAKI